MMTTLEIQKLSRQEKLRMMEVLWADLSRVPEKIESPAWHQDELRETENRLRLGEERILDWGEAKKGLRKRFN